MNTSAAGEAMRISFAEDDPAIGQVAEIRLYGKTALAKRQS